MSNLSHPVLLLDYINRLCKKIMSPSDYMLYIWLKFLVFY